MTTMTTDALRDQFYTSVLQRREVPAHLHDGLLRYLVDGYQPGHFLRAVLTNDLTKAVLRADDESLAGLAAVVRFLWNDVPSPAWGSRAQVEEWIKYKRAERTASET